MRKGGLQHARPCAAVPILPGSHHVPAPHCACSLVAPLLQVMYKEPGEMMAADSVSGYIAMMATRSMELSGSEK